MNDHHLFYFARIPDFKISKIFMYTLENSNLCVLRKKNCKVLKKEDVCSFRGV